MANHTVPDKYAISLKKKTRQSAQCLLHCLFAGVMDIHHDICFQYRKARQKCSPYVTHKALRKDSGTYLMNVNYRKLKGILYLKYGHSTLYNTEAAARKIA